MLLKIKGIKLGIKYNYKQCLLAVLRWKRCLTSPPSAIKNIEICDFVVVNRLFFILPTKKI